MISAIKIREYDKPDQPSLLELLRLNTPEYFSPDEENGFIQYLDEEIELYYVVEFEGVIIGCGGINFEDPNTGIISWDILHPNYQRKGVGSMLLKYRIDVLKSMRRIKSIKVRTSQLTHEFYQKIGFELQEVKEDYWAKGIDLYSMDYNAKTSN